MIFERREIRVRSAIVDGIEGRLNIWLKPNRRCHRLVHDALQEQNAGALASDYVFVILKGKPLEHRNVNRRVGHLLLS